MAISLGDIKKKKITVSPIKNTNTNNKTYNVAPPVNNQKEKQTYNLGEIRSNNITVTPLSERPKSKILTPSPQVTMTQNNINNQIAKNIVSGGIQNDIHNMNMIQAGKSTLDKKIDLSGKDKLGKTTPVDTSNLIYNDTGKKYGDYYYDNYELYKDMPIYEQQGKYYLKTNNGYEELGRLDKNGNVAQNVMTTKEADKEELEKAKKLGYKDNLTKITTQEYDNAQETFKKFQKEYKLSDKELNNWIRTGDLPIHVSIQTNSMTNLKQKANDYRAKMSMGAIQQYDQQGFDINKQIYMDTHNMNDEQKQQYISYITGKKDPTKKNESTFFKGSSLFDDGYQFGDVTGATLGSIGNAGYSLLKGTGKFIEGTSDFAENAIGSGLELTASDKDKKDVTTFHNNTMYTGYKYGNQNYWYDEKSKTMYDENWKRIDSFNLDRFQKRYTYSNGVAEFGRQMKEQTIPDETSQVFDEILYGNELRKASVLGNKSEAMLESLGQALPMMGAGGSVEGLYGAKAAVATTSGLTFSSTYGNAKTEAIRNGATEKEAMETAFVQATAETISEQFFDAIPWAKSAGWGKKLVGKVGNGVEKYLGSKTAKIVTKALDISGEGFEEIISNMLTAGGNDIVHYIDSDYSYGMENQTGNILEDMKNAMTSQDSMDSFISAIITSAILNGGSYKVNSVKINKIVKTYAQEYNMSIEEAKSRLKISDENIEFDTSNINQTQNTPNLPNNSVVEQRNINNNINNQVSDNVQNSMATMQNNNISENINNQQNNQLKNLIEPQKINYSKNVNDRIDLEDYDFKTEQVIKSAERNVIVRNYRQLDTLIDEALDTQSNKALHFGRINETITQRIKRKLENLPKMKAPYLTKEKYDLVMNQSEIRHLIDEKTMMTREDVHKYVGVLPEIISNFDSASYSIEPDSEGIRFKKKLPDGNYISFVLVSNKQSTLKAKSIHLDKIDYETKKRSISPTNDVLKTPDRTSETDGAFASMKADGVESGDIMSSDINVQDDTSVAFLDNDNTTISQKSQIAPLPSQYNMQQKIKNDTTKIKLSKAKEYQKNTIAEKIEKNDNVIKVQAEEIANQLNSGKPLNTKERRWIETSTESDILKNKVFKEDLDVNKINYEIQSNKKSLREANEKLDLMGYDKSINYVKNLIDDGKIPTASDVALAQRTLQEAAKKGDTEVVKDLVMDVAILGTELGQATQALSIINKLTPEGQLKLYSKIVHRAKLMGDKSFQDVEITPEMVEMILNAYDKNGNYDQNDLNNRVEQFKQKVADQLKTSVEEKIDAWRYLSMLGNPKTHIRNIISNVAMKCTIAYKNALARTIETFAPINTRTKTWKKSSQEVKQYAKETAIEMKDVITGETKYGEQASIESKKRIFKFAPLENISNLNSNLLEAEDWFFSKSAFINTFQEYLTANGIKTMEDINNNPEIVEKGKEYSVNQAEIATFRQYSKLASAINKIERNNKAAKYVIKATIPFKKTPINVAKAGVKYSPLGLIKNVTYDVYQVKKGNINASQFIDNLSQGLSGTSLTILGYALAKAGILTGSGGDDKDDKYDSSLGKQGYSIKIGNKYYSLSWLSPTAMPLFVGANMHEQLEEQKDWDMNILSESLTKTLDPLKEMSFVSSLTDALNSYGSNNDKIKGMGESVVQSYIGQFFPTLFSQFANVGDDTKRSTKASSNSSYKFGEQTVRSIMYKIPGLRNQLEPSTDLWGNEIKQNENILMRALESFILPYNAKEYKNSSIDKEIKKVYNDVGDTKIIPGYPQSYVKYNNEQYRMSAKEYTKYKKTYGTSANTMLNMLMNTSNYKNSTGKRKTRMIKKVYDYLREISQEEFLSNRNIDYDKKKFKYNKNDYKKIVNYITSSTQYKDDD